MHVPSALMPVAEIYTLKEIIKVGKNRQLQIHAGCPWKNSNEKKITLADKVPPANVFLGECVLCPT